jgi:hypothetical protein
MNRRTFRLSLRAVAILIAVMAVVDPAVTSMRSAKARIAVVAGDARDSALARRVVSSLENRFLVVDAPLPGADATVLVGETAPKDFRELSTPLFVVRDDAASDRVRIETVRTPRTAPLDATVPVTIVARTSGARGRSLETVLSAGGVVVNRAVQPIENDRSQLTLSFAPTAVGTVPLRVTARIAGARDSATADIVTDVRQVRWAVLFYDPQPSWMSTFVRRSIERDARFAVTSRVVTSRNVSTDAGTPPNRLDDLSSTSRFDAIVVGSPGALSDGEIAGLDDYARKRGGNVVLLCDGDFTPNAWRLTQVRQWTVPQRRRVALPVVSHTPGAPAVDTVLLASEISWPSQLPRTAEVLARTAFVGDSSSDRPVLWRVPLGAGRVIVSSALDAWRYRDQAQSAFDKLWRTLLADASSASLPAVDVRVSPAPVSPGADIDIDVTLRDAALREVASPSDTVRASVTADIVGARASRTPIRLWPAANVGEFHTTVRAPRVTGDYRVVVTSGGLSADAPLVVANDVSHPAPSDIDLLESLAASRGGKMISVGALDGLAPAIAAIVRPASRAETSHPMRSAWWILPFALALGAEWLLRRRAGLS